MIANIAVLGAVIVSAMGAIFGLYQARKADKSATTTKTIELGVKDLIDQYQETNKDLREQVVALKQEVAACKERESLVEAELHSIKDIVETLITKLDNKDAEIIGLKRRLGEI